MYALADMGLSDANALKFIYKLGQAQLYKSPTAFIQFCVDCAIFYTSSPNILMEKLNEMTDDEVVKWKEEFITMAECCHLSKII